VADREKFVGHCNSDWEELACDVTSVRHITVAAAQNMRLGSVCLLAFEIQNLPI